MNLIAILMAMGTEGFWKSFDVLRRFQGLVGYASWLQSRWGDRPWFNGPVGVMFTIAPGVVVVGLVQSWLEGGLLGWLLTLLFSVAVLVFCIGVRGLNDHVGEYLRALERGDPEGAYLYVREVIGEREPEDAGMVNRMLVETMLVRNNERLLAILFWFVILGPLGAVLYRSTTQLKGVVRAEARFRDDYLETVLRLQAILDWIPARITALCYAVIGSFVDAMHQWRRRVGEWRTDMYTANRDVLVGAGLGALQIPEPAAERAADLDALREEVIDTQALVSRTVVTWLAVFAVLTIAGWLT